MKRPLSRGLVLLAICVALVGGAVTTSASSPRSRPAAETTLPPLPGPLANPSSSPQPVAPASPPTAAPTPAAPAAPSTEPSSPPPDRPCGNHFAYGYCTWWAASQRCVPWFGNAYEWLARASQMGYRTGRIPAAGAIAVWGRGQHGASSVGHVAFVEEVHRDQTFVITEMNWSRGVGREDERTLRPGEVLGFVYALERPSTDRHTALVMPFPRILLAWGNVW